MTPNEARQSEFFQYLEQQAGQLQVLLDYQLRAVNKEFPLEGGAVWCLTAGGRFGVVYPVDYMGE